MEFEKWYHRLLLSHTLSSTESVQNEETVVFSWSSYLPEVDLLLLLRLPDSAPATALATVTARRRCCRCTDWHWIEFYIFRFHKKSIWSDTIGKVKEKNTNGHCCWLKPSRFPNCADDNPMEIRKTARKPKFIWSLVNSLEKSTTQHLS